MSISHYRMRYYEEGKLMAQCTAPKYGHRTASGRANCPVCGRGYSPMSRYPQLNYVSSYYPSGDSSHNSSTSGNIKTQKIKARWSKNSSLVFYTPAEIRTLTPVRENVEKRSNLPDLRDIFLCHAWDDRKNAAKSLYDLLESKGVRVWFSEKDVLLGSNLLREIDKGLSKSRIGIVLVTPSFLERIKNEGVAEKELSALLARDLLVPIVYNTTFEELREVSPLLGSRSGLDANEDSFEVITDKLAELVKI